MQCIVHHLIYGFVSSMTLCFYTQEHVSEAIKRHFGVESVKELGCGEVEKLLSDKGLSNQCPFAVPVIAYLTPLLFNTSDSSTMQTSMTGMVGFLGHQSSNSAMECLAAAPLLEDLHNWSHWDAVYKPTLGALSAFLQQQARHSSNPIHVLEVPPGRLLRINPDSSHGDFASAAKCGDAIATAGHLVSMIVRSSSVCDIPIQLLSSYIESALATLSSQHVEDPTQQLQSVAIDFVFQCLQRIPEHLCIHIAKEVKDTP